MNYVNPATASVATDGIFPIGALLDFTIITQSDIYQGQLTQEAIEQFVPFEITLMEGTPQTTSGAFNDDDVDLADIKDIEEW